MFPTLRLWSAAGVAFACVTFYGCSAVPSSMHVREGVSPQRQDDAVRFRTTYYFRTFDYCDDVDVKGVAAGQPKILHDSLYRFRMTGKADALANKIRFEAGTLTKGQIDPFGSAVEFDAKANRFRFKSQAQNESESRREDLVRELDALRDLYRKLKDDVDADGKMKLQQVIKNTISQLDTTGIPDAEESDQTPPETGQEPPPHAPADTNPQAPKTAEAKNDGGAKKPAEPAAAQSGDPSSTPTTPSPGEGGATSGNAEVKKANEKPVEKKPDEKPVAKKPADKPAVGPLKPELGKKPVTSQSAECPNNRPLRRGFQVFGPEGWRTFNQDERLLMAMSTSAKPLIDTLRELSDRVLQQDRPPTLGTENLLRERVSLLRAQRQLDKDTSSDPLELTNAIIETLSKDERARK